MPSSRNRSLYLNDETRTQLCRIGWKPNWKPRARLESTNGNSTNRRTNGRTDEQRSTVKVSGIGENGRMRERRGENPATGHGRDCSRLNEQKAKAKPRLASIRRANGRFNYSLHRDTKYSTVCEVADRTRQLRARRRPASPTSDNYAAKLAFHRLVRSHLTRLIPTSIIFRSVSPHFPRLPRRLGQFTSRGRKSACQM